MKYKSLSVPPLSFPKLLRIESALGDGKPTSSITVHGELLEFAGLEPGMPVIAWASHGSLFIDMIPNGADHSK